MTVLVFILAFFYLCLLLWLSFGLRYLENSKNEIKTSDKRLPSVALVVCAKNEEQRLPRLLRALSQQDFPSGKLEICLVDDRSTDRTGEIIAAFAATRPNVIHLRMHDTVAHFAPKKRAIDAAIRRTVGEIILLTDADAEPGPRWIHEMAAAFKPDVVMVCGYSPYVPRQTFWQKILALEYFSHAAIAAGGVGLGRPLTCTGSNMAYRRDAYFRIDGFAGIAPWVSGDDDLLLHKMHAAQIGKIVYRATPAAHVPVRPPNSWQEFKSQRTRYASKSLHYGLLLTLSLGLVYLFNLLICAGLLSFILGAWKFFIATLLIGLWKAVSDYPYLRYAAKLFGEEKLFSVFPMAALLHPFYVVYFATRGQFAKFSWREEQFTAQAAG
jgi:cellulose synthase/poly-beta-1,6-N-acetylglucosamine synthase-like glycosyltransferase